MASKRNKVSNEVPLVWKRTSESRFRIRIFPFFFSCNQLQIYLVLPWESNVQDGVKFRTRRWWLCGCGDCSLEHFTAPGPALSRTCCQCVKQRRWERQQWLLYTQKKTTKNRRRRVDKIEMLSARQTLLDWLDCQETGIFFLPRATRTSPAEWLSLWLVFGGNLLPVRPLDGPKKKWSTSSS